MKRMRLIIVGVMMISSTFLYAGPPSLPDGWSSNYIYANGIRIHYYRATPAPEKPVIVMVHGVTDIGLNWTILARKLDEDYDIYMLDARAHGLSDPFTPSDDGDTLVKDVVSFVETMGFERPILMGHSMGAATVMRLGAEYPDLARAIIMLDPGLGRRPPQSPSVGERSERVAPPPPPRQASTSPNNLSVNMRGSPEALVAQNNYSFDDLVATSQRRHSKWSLESHQYWALSKKQYHGPYTEEAWQAMHGTMRTGDSLANIRAPALILKADASPEQRAVHEDAVSVMQQGRLVHIDGGGHNLHHDEPERTLEVLNEFLTTLAL